MRKHLIAIYFFIIVITLFCSNLFAQHNHSHDEFKDKYIKSAPVSYKLSADVDLDSNLIYSTLEMEFVNQTDNAIDKIFLALPLNAFQDDGLLDRRYDLYGDSTLSKIPKEERPAITIDSVVFLGVPCENIDSLYGKSVLSIPLIKKIEKGEKGYFLISFNTRLSSNNWDKRHTLLVDNWFPKLYDPNDSIDYEPYFGWNRIPFTRADMTLSVTVDSAYDVVAGGELFNEKERFGVLDGPKDSVWVDLYANHSFDLNGNNFIPILKNGRKNYFYMSSEHADAPFLIGKDLKFDLLKRENRKLLVAYHNDTKFDWAENVALLVDSSINLIADYSDLLTVDELKIAASDTLLLSQPDDGIIFIPRDIKNRLELKILIMNFLVNRYLLSSNSPHKDLNEGYSYYHTAKLLYEKDGDDVYKQMEKLEERYKKKSALKLFEKDKKLQFAWGEKKVIDDSLFNADVMRLKLYAYHRFRLVPSLLESFRFICGKSIINKNLTEDIFSDTYFNRGNFNLLKQIDLDDDTLFNLDLELYEVRFSKTNGLFETSFKMNSNFKIDFPIEIAIVSNSADTLYDTVSYDYTSDQLEFSYKSKKVIDAVVIDPNYYFPDIDRYNNYKFRMPKNHVFSDPKSLFIGYREF